MQPLAARIRTCARLKGSFRLRSGMASDSHFDKCQFEADPQLLRDIAMAMVPLLPREIEMLAGLEMGGISVVTVLSQVTVLPAAFIRKETQEYGACRYAEGASLVGRQFVRVEDVGSTGGAILDAQAKLEADGLFTRIVLCAIDRETDGARVLAAADLQLRSLLLGRRSRMALNPMFASRLRHLAARWHVTPCRRRRLTDCWAIDFK